MSGIPPQLLEAVRERSRIADLFSPEQLRRRGSEFLTHCPWHADRNASLTVSPRLNRVHCFVCNRGVDAIGWLQERQGLSFREAVEELARRYGIPIPEEDPAAAARAQAEHAEMKLLLPLRAGQQQRFQRALATDLARDGPAAAFLRQRGIRSDTARSWGLGLNGQRLMLPIRDAQGRCCGFSGRSISGEEPKYRNTAADALFRKSELVFGLDRAADVIRRSGEALLVEGPMDVIQLHQGGIDHAVASLGTAFSPEQGQRLLRLGTKRLWIVYDSDNAGLQATARLIAAMRLQAVRGEPDLRVVSLPAGSDPDALVREQGPDALRRCLEESRHWLAWELDRLLADLQAQPDDLSLLQRCEREGAALLAELPRGGALRQRAEQRLREVLGVVPDGGLPRAGGGAERRSDEARGSRGRGRRAQNQEAAAVSDLEAAGSGEARVEQAERRALRLFLRSPECRDIIAQLTFCHPLHREAIGLLWHLRERLRRAGAELPATGAPQADGLVAAVMDCCRRWRLPWRRYSHLWWLVVGWLARPWSGILGRSWGWCWRGSPVRIKNSVNLAKLCSQLFAVTL